jgi:DNA-nicking Smr family endonuclease
MPRKSNKDLTRPPKSRSPRPSRSTSDSSTDYSADKTQLPHRRPTVPIPRIKPAPLASASTKTIDLHGLIPSQAIDKLDIEMRRAHSEGYSSVIVIHGKGGRDQDTAYILRDLVHRHLTGHNLVASFDVERTSTGTNQGATVVKLRTSK